MCTEAARSNLQVSDNSHTRWPRKIRWIFVFVLPALAIEHLKVMLLPVSSPTLADTSFWPLFVIAYRFSMSQNLDGGADLHLFVQLNDVFVEHANAARGGFRANGPRFSRAVNAIQRVTAIAEQV